MKILLLWLLAIFFVPKNLDVDTNILNEFYSWEKAKPFIIVRKISDSSVCLWHDKEKYWTKKGTNWWTKPYHRCINTVEEL